MKKWINGIYKHVIAVAVLIVYVFTANSLYVRFILKDGKPLGTPVALPALSTTKDVTFELDNLMQSLRVNGQDLYELKGYAFFQANKEQENTITIILSSKAGNIAFPTRTVALPNMIESYPGYTKAMDHAEFSLLLSQNALSPGTYRVGILLQNKNGPGQAYVLTGGTIKKTPNTLTYTLTLTP
jgi:hypothetical protein